MLVNIPDNDNPEDVSLVLEAPTSSASQPSSRSRAFAAGQPGGTIQEVRETGMPLCRRKGTRSRLLPLCHSGTGQDSVVLRLRKAEKANSSLPGELSKIAGAHRRNHRHQPAAAQAWRARRRIEPHLCVPTLLAVRRMSPTLCKCFFSSRESWYRCYWML